jgi:4-amino-4-deoxy-L-arabinose transferase-like glycosyltransferase
VRAVALALAIPLVVTLAGWPYVDLVLTAAALAALAALPQWQSARRLGDRRAASGWLIAAGLAAGLAFAVKYTGAYMLIALTALVACAAWREPQLPARRRTWLRLLAALRLAALFGSAALVVGGLWPLRNLLVTGDPVFPYHLGPLFPGGPDWDTGRTAFMQGGGWGASALWRASLLPLETTLLGRQGSSEFDATLGPLLLALLPLGLLTIRFGQRQRASTRSPDSLHEAAVADTVAAQVPARGAGGRQGRDTAHFWALGFSGILAVLWGEELAHSGVAMQSRLFLPLFLALTVPAALAWTRLDALRVPAVSLNRLVTIAIAICFALTLAGQAVQTLQVGNLAELAGVQSRDDYLAQQLGPYAAAMRQVDVLGPHARVLFLWEPRSYLTHARTTPDVFLDRFNYLYRRCGDAAGIMHCLRAQGYTHVLVYLQGLRLVRGWHDGRDSPSELATLDTLLARWQPIYRDDAPLVGAGPPGKGWYALYSLGSAT